MSISFWLMYSILVILLLAPTSFGEYSKSQAKEVHVDFSLSLSEKHVLGRRLSSVDVLVTDILHMKFELYGTEYDIKLEKQPHGSLFASNAELNFSGSIDEKLSGKALSRFALPHFRSKNAMIIFLPLYIHHLDEDVDLVDNPLILDGLIKHEGHLYEVRTNPGSKKLTIIDDRGTHPLGDCGAVMPHEERTDINVEEYIEHATETHPHGRRLVVEKWSSCYDRDDILWRLNMGVVVGSKLFSRFRSSTTDDETAKVAIVSFLQSTFAKANEIYETQMNVILSIHHTVIITEKKAEYETFDNSGCTIPIQTQLNEFSKWSKPKDESLWHLFDDCFPGSGIVGIAWLGVLCQSSGGNGVTLYTASRTFKTFAHEVGHNFNAQHSFERGQGNTGGIMDYGDGKLNGEYQFNSEFRKTQVCAHIDSVKEKCVTAKHMETYKAVCGNGILERGEECECKDLSNTCKCCDMCQITPGKQCSPESLTGSKCCTDTCEYDNTNICDVDDDTRGYCVLGSCQSTNCDIVPSLGNFCGLQANGCRIRCERNGVCDDIETIRFGDGRYVNALSDVSCNNDKGKCNAGLCIATDSKEGDGTGPPPEAQPQCTKTGKLNDCDTYNDCGFIALGNPLTGSKQDGETLVECDQSCTANNECHSFSFTEKVDNKGACSLWSKIRSVSDLGTLPGTNSYICPKRGLEFIDDCDRHTSQYWTGIPDVAQKAMGGWQLTGCDAECKREEKCHSFSWHTTTKHCNLWSAAKSASDLVLGTGLDEGWDTYVCPGQGEPAIKCLHIGNKILHARCRCSLNDYDTTADCNKDQYCWANGQCKDTARPWIDLGKTDRNENISRVTATVFISFIGIACFVLVISLFLGKCSSLGPKLRQFLFSLQFWKGQWAISSILLEITLFILVVILNSGTWIELEVIGGVHLKLGLWNACASGESCIDSKQAVARGTTELSICRASMIILAITSGVGCLLNILNYLGRQSNILACSVIIMFMKLPSQEICKAVCRWNAYASLSLTFVTVIVFTALYNDLVSERVADKNEGVRLESGAIISLIVLFLISPLLIFTHEALRKADVELHMRNKRKSVTFKGELPATQIVVNDRTNALEHGVPTETAVEIGSGNKGKKLPPPLPKKNRS